MRVKRWVALAAVVVLVVMGVAFVATYLRQRSEGRRHLATLLNALPELGLSPSRTISRDALFADEITIGAVKFTRTSTNEPVALIGGHLMSAGFVSDCWALSVGALGDSPEAVALHTVSIILDARNVGVPERNKAPNSTEREPLTLTCYAVLGRSCKADLGRLLPKPTSISPGLGGREDWSYSLFAKDTWKWVDLSFDKNGLLQSVSCVAKTLTSGQVPWSSSYDDDQLAIERNPTHPLTEAELGQLVSIIREAAIPEDVFQQMKLWGGAEFRRTVESQWYGLRDTVEGLPLHDPWKLISDMSESVKMLFGYTFPRPGLFDEIVQPVADISLHLPFSSEPEIGSWEELARLTEPEFAHQIIAKHDEMSQEDFDTWLVQNQGKLGCPVRFSPVTRKVFEPWHREWSAGNGYLKLITEREAVRSLALVSWGLTEDAIGLGLSSPYGGHRVPFRAFVYYRVYGEEEGSILQEGIKRGTVSIQEYNPEHWDYSDWEIAEAELWFEVYH